MRILKNDFQLGSLDIINFRGLSMKEREAVREMRNDPRIRAWMYNRKKISPAEHALFFRSIKKRENDFYWMVRSAGLCLGVIYLNRIDYANRHAYLGIYANPFLEMKGKGRLLMDCLKYVGFKKGKLRTIKLEVIADNKKAIAFYKNNGFAREGRLKEYVFDGESWKDVLIMGIRE